MTQPMTEMQKQAEVQLVQGIAQGATPNAVNSNVDPDVAAGDHDSAVRARAEASIARTHAG